MIPLKSIFNMRKAHLINMHGPAVNKLPGHFMVILRYHIRDPLINREKGVIQVSCIVPLSIGNERRLLLPPSSCFDETRWRRHQVSLLSLQWEPAGHIQGENQKQKAKACASCYCNRVMSLFVNSSVCMIDDLRSKSYELHKSERKHSHITQWINGWPTKMPTINHNW